MLLSKRKKIEMRMETSVKVFVLFYFVSILSWTIRIYLIEKEHLSKGMKEVRGTRSNSWCKDPKAGPFVACLRNIKEHKRF